MPRWSGGAWRAILFAPVGDGQTRRRGSDAVRAGACVVAITLCWLATRVNSSSEHTIVRALTPAPDGIKWLVTSVWWVASLGLIAVVAVLALVSRRWSVIRDCMLSGGGAWMTCVLIGYLLGPDGGRPADGAPHGFPLVFPVARVAATVAVATAALPYLSRWVQRAIKVTIVLLALATVVSQSGLPVPVLASLAVGVLLTAVVHLVFGSPLGLLSAAEVSVLVDDLGIHAADVAPTPVQEWGVGRFTGRTGGMPIDVAVYGRDASDAQLLAKTARFLLYRDSGPTLTLTRRQQVEHEAYLTLLAEQAGVCVSRVLAAGPAGPAHDALLVTCPPAGRSLSELPPYVLPAEAEADGADGSAGAVAPGGTGATAAGAAPAGTASTAMAPGSVAHGTPAAPAAADDVMPDEPVLSDGALDGIFGQVLSLRRAGIAHGALSAETILVDDEGRSGFVDMRAASTVARPEQLDQDVAAVLAATASVVGPERAAASAARVLPADALAAALPFLQRAALNPGASRSMRGKKALLKALREDGAKAAGVEVPKLIEPRRVSWINFALVVGTLIGGWALIGVLVNVTKSWSTITGANWAWVAAVFVLAQAAYPALAVTTVGSVTDTMPYGRTVALEVSNTFVSLAGGSMAALATRVRFFQQQGYDATLAVSSGVLISTASWIVKGGLFLIALPIAFSQFHFANSPSETGGGSGGSTATLVWFIVIAVVVVGVLLGLLLAVPRWRRLAAAKLRPKASEVWTHLKVLSTHPRNLVEIFGGEILGQLLVAMALGASLHAFDQHLSLAALIIVLTLGSMLGGVSPVPGGMGVVEAGMILGLTAAGIPETDAVAAVFVQRLFTAYLPPIWGWFCLVWMRKKEYL
ncbi:MAG: lysylphosphatidylglycerol synthase transmembrane domain-containing protein [Acidimicrobiales bacterium]